MATTTEVDSEREEWEGASGERRRVKKGKAVTGNLEN